MAEGDPTPATGEPDKDAPAGPQDEPDLTGAQNPDAVKRALAAERDAAKEAKKRADAAEAKVREYQDRDKSDQQKLEERAVNAEKTAAEREARLLRFEVAAAKDIPLKHAHRLQGSTKEELEQDAAELAKELVAGGGSTGFDGGTRGEPARPNDMDAAIRQSAGRR